MSLEPPTCDSARSLLLLGVPLLLMGALIVGLQIGEDELEQSVAQRPDGTREARTRAGPAAGAGRGARRAAPAHRHVRRPGPT